MACSKLEARGHLLHKTGTPPKHFSQECTRNHFFAYFMQFFLFLLFYPFQCIYPKEIHAYSLVYPVENFSVAFLMGISIAVVQEFKAFSDGIRILQEFQSEKQMADYYDCFISIFR